MRASSGTKLLQLLMILCLAVALSSCVRRVPSAAPPSSRDGHAAEDIRTTDAQGDATDASADDDEGYAATTVERGSVVQLVERFFFEAGQASLSPDAAAAVARVAAQVNERRFRRHRLYVEGHSDASGSPEANLRLSSERADIVAGLLIQHGVDSGRIYSQGYGDTRPLVAERSAAGGSSAEVRARNRRVDVILGNVPDERR